MGCLQTQGVALGWYVVPFQGCYVAPFQGFIDGMDSRPRALPWAGMSCPFRALLMAWTPDPGRCPGLVCRALSGLLC